jgi:TolA-binding protein
MNIRRTALFCSLFLLLLTACTTERDGLVYRTFHNTTARYNGYFYANESMKEADGIIEDAHVEDYDEILPIFIVGSEESAQSVYPQMELVIEKATKVIERHTMNPPSRESKSRKKPEMNKWIDNNWLLMGEAYYYKGNSYKAEELFRYVTRKFKDEATQAEAFAWMARVYIEREEWLKASNSIIKAANMKDEVPDEVRAFVYMVHADYFIRQGDYKEAAEKLEKAISYTKKKKDRARPTFILAQLKQDLKKSQESINLYEQVLKLHPEYEMEFYARINQALAYSRRGGDPNEIRATLLKMLKDEKNLEYKDQIYYALADLEFDERNQAKGIEYLKESIASSAGNQKQKSKAFLRLADIYFNERTYEYAQLYYDSTFQNINEDHKRYVEIKNLAESLTDLVNNLNIIYFEDSVQALATLSPNALEQRLKTIQKQEQRRIDEEKQERENALSVGAQPGDDGPKSSFWVYNPKLRENGYAAFRDYWGDRELEDNWRRRNKMQSSFDDGEELPEDPFEAAVGKLEGGGDDKPQDEARSMDELMADIPLTDQAMAASNARLAEAYYNAGLVYKEKLEDFDNAVEKWEVLTTRLDDSDYHPTSYYQLYRAYYSKEQGGEAIFPCPTCSSAYWAEKIAEKYPGSEWQKLVENPNYTDYKEILEAEERAAYEQLYLEFKFRQYLEVIQLCNEVIETQPENHLLCKYRVLKAQSIGYMDGLTGQRENYINELNTILTMCPETPEAEFAQSVLDALNDKSAKVEDPTPEELPSAESIFAYDAEAPHYFALVFKIADGDINKIKASVADFNLNNFKSAGLKTTSNLLGKDSHIVLVKTFERLSDGQGYYKAFSSNQDIVKELNSKGFDLFLISKENYVTLFKNKNLEDYAQFFTENYDL